MASSLVTPTIASQLQNYVCQILKNDPALSSLSVAVLAESALDLQYEVINALQKQGILMTVMTPQMTYQGRTVDRQCWTCNELLVQTIENPKVHRPWMSKNGLSVGTAEDMSLLAAEALGGPDSGHFGEFTPVRVREQVRDNLVVSEATFGCTVYQRKVQDYFTVLSTNIGDYDGAVLVLDETAADPALNQKFVWVQKDPTQLPAATIIVYEWNETNGWMWVLTTREISIVLLHGPSPDEAQELTFDSPQQRQYLTAERTRN